MTSHVEVAAQPGTARGHAPVALPVSVLVGNPRRGSRTLDIATRVGAMLHGDLLDSGVPLGEPGLVDLSAIGPDLARWESSPPAADAATATVCASRLLVVASPTLKASYSGLLKLFLDRLPRRALTGVVCVPVMTAASPAHTFAVDACLRPLLVELGATVPVQGLTVLEADFGALDEAVARWRAAATPILSAVLAL